MPSPRPMVYSGNDVDEQFRCSSVRSELVDFRHRCSVGKCVRSPEFLNGFFFVYTKKKRPLRVLLLFNGITELYDDTRPSCLSIVIIICILVYCGMD